MSAEHGVGDEPRDAPPGTLVIRDCEDGYRFEVRGFSAHVRLRLFIDDEGEIVRSIVLRDPLVDHPVVMRTVIHTDVAAVARRIAESVMRGYAAAHGVEVLPDPIRR